MPAFPRTVSMFQGPVIQNAALRSRKASCAVSPSTFELIRPVLVPPVDHRGVLQERRVRDPELARVERAALRAPEDVAAQAREEAGTCGTRHRRSPAGRRSRAGRRPPLELERLRLEVGPVLGHLREPRVDEEADVLDRRRHAVEPAHRPAVRERRLRVLRDRLQSRLLRVDRHDRAVRGQLAGPVVRGDDHVRSGLGANRLQVVADVAELLLDDLDGATPRLRAHAPRGALTSALRSRSVQILIDGVAAAPLWRGRAAQPASAGRSRPRPALREPPRRQAPAGRDVPFLTSFVASLLFAGGASSRSVEHTTDISFHRHETRRAYAAEIEKSRSQDRFLSYRQFMREGCCLPI